MTQPDGTPHRREDGELLGWIRPEGDLWVAVDILGREASAPVEWLDAEAVLDERGLAYLGEVWMLERPDAVPLRVRLVEVSPPAGQAEGRVVVKTDDFGAIDAPVTTYPLPWPAPASLRLRVPGDPDGREFWMQAADAT
jgi:hypothetical protein